MSARPRRPTAPTFEAKTEALLSRPDSRKGFLQRWALAEILKHEEKGEIPTDQRFIWYELKQRGIVKSQPPEERAKRGDRQNLIDAVMWLRDRGAIPWGWIIDSSRSLHNPHVADSVAEWLLDVLPQASINPWGGTLRPLVLAETRAVAGAIDRALAHTYRIAVAPTGGQAGGFLVTEIAPILADGDHRVMYLGDRDDQGDQIEDNTRRVLEHHAGRDLVWERVALTEEQVEDLRGRGVEPVEKLDRRFRPPRVCMAYECEAFGQGAIVQLVRQRLDELLPEPIADVHEHEAAEQEEIKYLLADR